MKKLYGLFGKFIKSRAVQDNSGMTMVEVLMGFVILLIMMGSLSSIMAFSSNMLEQSADLRRAEQSLQSCVYKKTPDASAGLVNTDGKITLFSYNPKTGTVDTTDSVDITSNLYQLESKNVLTSEETETLDVTVFYFKAP